MKRFLIATAFVFGIHASASALESGTGTISTLCVGLTTQECDDWVDLTYNSNTPPPPPNLPLAISNLQQNGPYETNGYACMVYNYTRPNGDINAFEVRQVFPSDWSSPVIDDSKQITLPNASGERCDPIPMPSTAGTYNANFCLSANGATPCVSTQFTVIDAPSSSANVSILWDSLLDAGWQGTNNVFPAGTAIRVLFGAQNNDTSNDVTFDADFNISDANGNFLETQSGSITMPAGSNKDVNGNDPRFDAQIDQAGTYITQLCIDNTCQADKTVTIGATSSVDVSLIWVALMNNAWQGTSTFDANGTIRVLFGAQNNDTANDATFNADLNISDADGNYIETHSGAIVMPAGSNKDVNGDDPRFTTSIGTPGTYQVQLCVGTVCKETITIIVQ